MGCGWGVKICSVRHSFNMVNSPISNKMEYMLHRLDWKWNEQYAHCGNKKKKKSREKLKETKSVHTKMSFDVIFWLLNFFFCFMLPLLFQRQQFSMLRSRSDDERRWFNKFITLCSIFLQFFDSLTIPFHSWLPYFVPVSISKMDVFFTIIIIPVGDAWHLRMLPLFRKVAVGT